MGSPRFPLCNSALVLVDCTQNICRNCFFFGRLHSRRTNIKELNAKVSANNCHKYTQLIIATFIYHKTFCGMCKLFIFGFKTYLTREKKPFPSIFFFSLYLSLHLAPCFSLCLQCPKVYENQHEYMMMHTSIYTKWFNSFYSLCVRKKSVKKPNKHTTPN